MLSDNKNVRLVKREKKKFAKNKFPLDKSHFITGDQYVIEANQAVVDHCIFGFDPKFDHSDLKADPDGAYEKVFAKLSYDEYGVKEAAQTLYDSVTAVLAQ